MNVMLNFHGVVRQLSGKLSRRHVIFSAKRVPIKIFSSIKLNENLLFSSTLISWKGIESLTDEQWELFNKLNKNFSTFSKFVLFCAFLQTIQSTSLLVIRVHCECDDKTVEPEERLSDSANLVAINSLICCERNYVRLLDFRSNPTSSANIKQAKFNFGTDRTCRHINFLLLLVSEVYLSA